VCLRTSRKISASTWQHTPQITVYNSQQEYTVHNSLTLLVSSQEQHYRLLLKYLQISDQANGAATSSTADLSEFSQ